jgi:hypothetical protein
VWCVLFERGVIFCVICVFCLIVVPLPPGKNPFAVQFNNNNNKPARCRKQAQLCLSPAWLTENVNLPHAIASMRVLLHALAQFGVSWQLYIDWAWLCTPRGRQRWDWPASPPTDLPPTERFQSPFNYVFSNINYIYKAAAKQSKAIPITGSGDLQGCEMLRIPHRLDSRLT